MAAGSSAFLLLMLLLDVSPRLRAEAEVKLEVEAKLVSDFLTSSEFGSSRSVCKSVPSTMSLCHGLGYQAMRLPNLLGHDTLREAQQQSGAWVPLVTKRCHGDTRRFLCSLLAPACLEELGVPVPPCRSFCTSVRDACLPVMSAFGFPWPDAFNCTRFPTKDELCIRGDEDASQAELQETDKGSVLCDACSPDSSGENEILKNFCSSQFGFRLQIGSSSLEGAGLRVVPQGRSRVLRWAGSEEEQQVAMQQSSFWILEKQNCSCPALEGGASGTSGSSGASGTSGASGASGTSGSSGVSGTSGSSGSSGVSGTSGSSGVSGASGASGASGSSGTFLVLGDIRDGRLVVSRLVKWTRSEKELKKFIRKLTRQSC